MTYSIYDTRSLEEKESDLRELKWIQTVLEDSIANYALENPEDLYDTDEQEILRKLEFSQGTRGHFIVIAPDGFIRLFSRKFPVGLMADIHNALLIAE